MRYINVQDIQLPDGWEEKARKLLDELIKANSLERKKIIRKNAAIWREVKEALSTLSHGKCWYCV